MGLGVCQGRNFVSNFYSTIKALPNARLISLMDMIHQLAQRCLVSIEDPGTGTPYLTIHRSLQQGLLQKLNVDVLKRTEIFEGVVRIVRRITPSASPIQVFVPLTQLFCKHLLLNRGSDT